MSDWLYALICRVKTNHKVRRPVGKKAILPASFAHLQAAILMLYLGTVGQRKRAYSTHTCMHLHPRKTSLYDGREKPGGGLLLVKQTALSACKVPLLCHGITYNARKILGKQNILDFARAVQRPGKLAPKSGNSYAKPNNFNEIFFFLEKKKQS
jgi:hypothetical protein